MASLVSLLGDGFFLVAIALQVYAIDRRPLAMSLVGMAWTGAALVCLLAGGWASDRFDRRRIMIAADIVRGVAIGAMGVLSLTGGLRLVHMVVLGAFFGASNAFFNPASTAVVPDLLPPEDLTQANAFLGVAKPAMIRVAGPALGGLLIAAAGPGAAFLVDAGTFAVSALLLTGVRTPTGPTAAGTRPDASPRALSEGFAYVRRNPWCWAWLVGSAVSLLLYYGPVEVLLPFVLLELGLTEAQVALRLTAIFGAGGVGSILMAILVGQRGLPRRHLTLMYVAEALAIGALAVYGLSTMIWPFMLASFVANAMFSYTEIGWTTTMQSLVPGKLLGRVSSLDWLTSLGLIPLSFALAGPVAAVAGARPTLVWAGGAGAVTMLALLLVPGARDPERTFNPDPGLVAALAEEPFSVEAGPDVLPDPPMEGVGDR